MARGKIFTNRKQKVSVGEEKIKKSSQTKKKEKKSKGATKEDGHPKGGGDYFDPKTGVVFSTRPEDSCIPLMEANIAKFYKEQGQLDNPEDHVTVALHVIDYLAGDTNKPSLVSTIPPPTSFEEEEEGSTTKAATATVMASSDAPITFWQEVKDPKTSHPYYWNPSTNEVSWTLPANGVLTSEASQRSDEIHDPEAEEERAVVSKTRTNAPLTNGKDDGEVNTTQSKEKTSKKAEVTKKSRSNENQLKQESQMLIVSSLFDEISRKFTYLHIDTSKLTELQLLHIKLQTRLEDWKEGALPSQYVLEKLRGIDSEILDIVQKGVSPEWKCLWDRGTCRFYYKHKTSGSISWEFPTDIDNENKEELEDDEGGVAVEEVAPSVETMEKKQEEQITIMEQEERKEEKEEKEIVEVVEEEVQEEQDMDIDSGSNDELPALEDIEAINEKEKNTKEENAITPQQPLVSLYGDDLPPPSNQVEEEEDEAPPTDDAMILTELEAANQEALLRARLLEKMKANPGTNDNGEGGEPVIDWKPPTTVNQKEEEEEEREKEEEHTNKEIVEREVHPQVQAKEEEPTQPSPKEEVTTKLTSENTEPKRSSSPPQSYRESRHSKRVKSESSSKRRSHQYHTDSDYSDERHSRSRRRSRDRHSSRRTRRSRKYSDDSDDEGRSHKRGHRSRSKGRSRRKKDRRRRHRHGDSSSDDDKGRKRRHRHGDSDSSSDDERHKRRQRSSSPSEEEKEKKETTPPPPPVPPITKLEGASNVPPPLEKSFVPAKFKPKGKTGEEDKGESTLSQTQVEMIHNIATATGYPVVYTMDPQQYGQVTSYGQAAATYGQTAAPYGYTAAAGGVAYDSNYVPATTSSNVTPVATTTAEPVATTTAEPVAMTTAKPVAMTTTEPVAMTTSTSLATQENNTISKEEETSAPQEPDKPVPNEQTTDTQKDKEATPPKDTPTTAVPTTDTPTNNAAPVEEAKAKEEPVQPEEIKPVPVRDSTPPLPAPTTGQTGYTISAPSTSYPPTTYQQVYSGDQTGAYAYTAYPYYATTAAGYDPTQYAAAMNYYAAYQAAAYGAYYQQAGGTQNGGAAQPPTTKI